MEEADWLTQAAKDRGVDITRRQFADWHRAGLLPTPTIQPLGRGRGSRAWYPPGTLIQAIACKNHLRRNRDLRIVGWLLWMDGFQVAESLWKVHFEKARQHFVAIDNAAESDEFGHKVNAIIATSKEPMIRIVRRQIREGRSILIQRVLAVVFGAFFHSGGGGKEEENQQTLLARVIGLQPPAGKKPVESSGVSELSGSAMATKLNEFTDYSSNTKRKLSQARSRVI